MNVDVSLILCTVHVASAANPTHVLLMADANSVWKSKGGTEGLHGPSPFFLRPHCRKYMVCIHAFILQVGDSISVGAVR